jgi:hypothetical protein
MANINPINAFISLNDIINNFIISYTGPGKLIPDSKRTEVVFHARRCLQEFAYETLKSQFTFNLSLVPSSAELDVPADFVTVISLVVDGTNFSQVEENPGVDQYVYSHDDRQIYFNSADAGSQDLVLTYLSNALTTDENAAIPKLAEEALYACMVYAILANRTNIDPNLLQRLLIEKIDKLERSKSRLVFTNFSE